MSFETKVFSGKSDVLGDLERQMSELMALRRALCLLMASQSRPKGVIGRRAARHSVRRAFYSANRAQPGAVYSSGRSMS